VSGELLTHTYSLLQNCTTRAAFKILSGLLLDAMYIVQVLVAGRNNEFMAYEEFELSYTIALTA